LVNTSAKSTNPQKFPIKKPEKAIYNASSNAAGNSF